MQPLSSSPAAAQHPSALPDGMSHLMTHASWQPQHTLRAPSPAQQHHPELRDHPAHISSGRLQQQLPAPDRGAACNIPVYPNIPHQSTSGPSFAGVGRAMHGLNTHQQTSQGLFPGAGMLPQQQGLIAGHDPRAGAPHAGASVPETGYPGMQGQPGGVGPRSMEHARPASHHGSIQHGVSPFVQPGSHAAGLPDGWNGGSQQQQQYIGAIRSSANDPARSMPMPPGRVLQQVQQSQQQAFGRLGKAAPHAHGGPKERLTSNPICDVVAPANRQLHDGSSFTGNPTAAALQQMQMGQQACITAGAAAGQQQLQQQLLSPHSTRPGSSWFTNPTFSHPGSTAAPPTPTSRLADPIAPHSDIPSSHVGHHTMRLQDQPGPLFDRPCTNRGMGTQPMHHGAGSTTLPGAGQNPPHPPTPSSHLAGTTQHAAHARCPSAMQGSPGAANWPHGDSSKPAKIPDKSPESDPGIHLQHGIVGNQQHAASQANLGGHHKQPGVSPMENQSAQSTDSQHHQQQLGRSLSIVEAQQGPCHRQPRAPLPASNHFHEDSAASARDHARDVLAARVTLLEGRVRFLEGEPLTLP